MRWRLPAFTPANRFRYDEGLPRSLIRKGGAGMAVTADLAVGFLGAGQMATALARGWLAAGLTTTERLSASDPLPQAREAFAADTHSNSCVCMRMATLCAALLMAAGTS